MSKPDTPSRRTRVRKEYGVRSVSPLKEDYARMAIPPRVLEDDEIDINRGDKIRLVGIVDGDEQYLRIEPVSE